MLANTKRRLTEITSPLLGHGERIDVMAHLITGSVLSVIKHLPAEILGTLGTVEFAVLSDRRFWIFASDLEGRPTPRVLLEVPRSGFVVTGSGGFYTHWVDLTAPGLELQLRFPIVAWRDGARLVNALASAT
ncbi:MAG TPA: hypothetical protein VG014_12140 [Acidimicrobiales bacterium]|jgi:hypothetical protein|nr:hypothetical protein [Acidimicrobiales bacterium]